MQLKSLSTSLSNTSPVFTTLAILFWIVFWLLLLELVLYLAVPYNPPTVEPNAAQRYLEYGRSVEGKVRRMIGPTDETTVPVTLAGWLDPTRERWNAAPSRQKTLEGLLIAIYGMSFAQHVGVALEKLSPQVAVRFLGGPGASPNHSYATYLLDRGRHQAQVVILGIAAANLTGMTTFTSMNKSFEYPTPFTYPKYRPVGDHLEAFWPSVRTMADLRRALQDKALWEKYQQEMQAEDRYYQPFLFSENFMDDFAILRFLRRSWAGRQAREVRSSFYGNHGFIENSEVIQALRLIIKEFARQVTSDGQLPIVMLFNNRGYSDQLDRVLADTLKAANIPTMSSHTLAPADDPKNIAPDGFHFSRAVNKQFATEILKIIKERKGIVVSTTDGR